METSIFYCLISTSESLHDRQQFNDSEKTKRQFFDWVQQQRKKVENDTGRTAIVKNLKFI